MKPCEKDRLWKFLLSHFLSAFTFSYMKSKH